MASYRVLLKPAVEKDLRAIPGALVAKILKRIEALRDNPLPPQSVKLVEAEGLYRIRVGDYRIVYGVSHEARQVMVHYVRHRRDVYRQL
jgi:mRNA interferase RelE/StbE